jgi:hypothetical protein
MLKKIFKEFSQVWPADPGQEHLFCWYSCTSGKQISILLPSSSSKHTYYSLDSLCRIVTMFQPLGA